MIWIWNDLDAKSSINQFLSSTALLKALLSSQIVRERPEVEVWWGKIWRIEQVSKTFQTSFWMEAFVKFTCAIRYCHDADSHHDNSITFIELSLPNNKTGENRDWLRQSFLGRTSKCLMPSQFHQIENIVFQELISDLDWGISIKISTDSKNKYWECLIFSTWYSLTACQGLAILSFSSYWSKGIISHHVIMSVKEDWCWIQVRQW